MVRVTFVWFTWTEWQRHKAQSLFNSDDVDGGDEGDGDDDDEDDNDGDDDGDGDDDDDDGDDGDGVLVPLRVDGDFLSQSNKYTLEENNIDHTKKRKWRGIRCL